MDPITTDELLKVLSQLDTTTELKNYTESHTSSEGAQTLSEYLESLLESKGLKKSDVIRDADLQRNYGYQVFSGLRTPGRNKLLALCLSMQLTVKEAQHVLKLANEGTLYSKNRRDAILIFALQKNLSVMAANDLLYEMQEEILA
ncbi:MAG TPA: XRE family transcriptional regulator [Candidatus Pelethocola excrementipullorum]|nr:XRE family transcriptional regulator [Candidatus Pelethocola excrementipullorum]